MVLTLYLANLKEYLRDRMTLFWTLAFPILFIVLLGLIFSGGGSTTYNVALVNLGTGQSGLLLGLGFAHARGREWHHLGHQLPDALPLRHLLFDFGAATLSRAHRADFAAELSGGCDAPDDDQ